MSVSALNFISAFRFFENFYKDDARFYSKISLNQLRSLKILLGIFTLIPSFLRKPLVGIMISPISVKASYLGFVFSRNQAIALEQINQLFSDSHFVFVDNRSENEAFSFLSNTRLLISVLWEPKQSLLYLKHAYENSCIENNSMRYLKLVGLYNFILASKLDFKCLVNFNDHIAYNVFLADVFQLQGKKTCYIQHAPVSSKFPDLYHDFNLLYSKDSLIKYNNPNKNKVFLIGDLRIRGLKRKQEFTPKIQSILICSNKIDRTRLIVDLYHKLEKKYLVYLRPHPADKRVWPDNLKLTKNTSIQTDFELCDAVISDESAVFLEALYCGKYIYKCVLSETRLDNYGFLAQGLITKEYFALPELETSIGKCEVNFDIKKLNLFIGPINDFSTNLNKIKSKIEDELCR